MWQSSNGGKPLDKGHPQQSFCMEESTFQDVPTDKAQGFLTVEPRLEFLHLIFQVTGRLKLVAVVYNMCAKTSISGQGKQERVGKTKAKSLVYSRKHLFLANYMSLIEVNP